MTHFLLPTCLVTSLSFALALAPAPQPPARALGADATMEPVDPAVPPTPAAGVCRITIEGSKQGHFKNEDQRKGADHIVGLRVGYEVTSPRDAATGQASGKRQHHPLTFVKEVGSASPQLFNACVNNEALTSVTIDFEKSTNESAVGAPAVPYYTIKLINACVSNVRYFTEDNRPLEEVTLTFQKIELNSPTGKTAGTDDWVART
jgi:type VI secretion system secreted protein Hcp